MKAELISTYAQRYAELMRQLKFRESHYKLVGEITVNFSAIEYFLTTFASQLISPGDSFAATLALKKLDLRRTIDISRTVFLLQAPDSATKTEFLAIIDTIDNLRIKRNDIIHSMWNYDYPNERVGFDKLVVDKKKILRIRNESFTLQGLENLSREVSIALKQLTAFIRDWRLKQQPNNA